MKPRAESPGEEIPWRYWNDSLFFAFAEGRVEELTGKAHAAAAPDEEALAAQILAEARAILLAPAGSGLPLEMCHELLRQDYYRFTEVTSKPPDLLAVAIRGGVKHKCDQMRESAAVNTPPRKPMRKALSHKMRHRAQLRRAREVRRECAPALDFLGWSRHDLADATQGKVSHSAVDRIFSGETARMRQATREALMEALRKALSARSRLDLLMTSPRWTC